MSYLTVTTALSKIRFQQQQPSHLLETYLTRIQQREADVNAWEFLAIASSKHQAILQDQKMAEGVPDDLLRSHPLLGIPVGIKDIFATVDMPTAWGLPRYAGRYLPEDAAVVRRLRAAGAIPLGKTVTTELATAAPGQTRNPHHLDHSPGGSSSGSAAAVADGMVPLALGSQTMGSVLRPAAYCGIFGFKPSFGSISRQGMMPVAENLDQVGVFATCLEDIRLAFEVLADPQNSTALNAAITPSESMASPQLAWIKTPDWHLVEPVAQARLAQVVEVLSKAGFTIHSVELPLDCIDYWETVQTLCAYGLYQHHGWLLDQHPSLGSPQLQTWMQRGQNMTASDYAAARRKQRQYQASIGAILQRFDGIMTPVTPGPAPLGRENTGSPRFCSLWTACGLPALSMPVGKTPEGLPLGCQFVGRYGQDRQFLSLAERYWSSIQSVFGDLSQPECPREAGMP